MVLSLEMVNAICTMADDRRTQMHDLLTASTLLCKLAPRNETANVWIKNATTSHEYAAIRETCQRERVSEI